MYIKIVSLIITLIAGELFAYGTQSPSDPIFLFVSNNPFVVLLRLALAGLLVTIAFRKAFKYKISRNLILILGTLLSIFGLFSMTSQFMIDTFSTYIKLCDFMMMACLGLTTTAATLAMPARRSFQIKKTRLYRFQHNLALKLNEPNQGQQKSAF